MLRNLVALLLLSKAGLAQEASPTRWALDAGWGVRLWETSDLSPQERKYLDQGRVGGVQSLEVSVFPWRNWGVGLMGVRFTASASDSSMTFLDKSQGSAQDEYRILYAAPTLNVKREVGERGLLVANAGLGMFLYTNESRAGAFPGVIEGSTVGLHAAGGAEFRLLPRFGVGVGARVLYGEIEKLHYNAIETSTRPISLTRLDVTAGLRFYP